MNFLFVLTFYQPSICCCHSNSTGPQKTRPSLKQCVCTCWTVYPCPIRLKWWSSWEEPELLPAADWLTHSDIKLIKPHPGCQTVQSLLLKLQWWVGFQCWFWAGASSRNRFGSIYVVRIFKIFNLMFMIIFHSMWVGQLRSLGHHLMV